MSFDAHHAYNNVGLNKDRSLWEVTAEEYDAWIASEFQEQYEVNWNVLTKHIEPDLRVLDVGCGPGDLSIRIAQRCHEVWGVDVTPGMIRIAEEKAASAAENVFFHEADACDLPFAGSCFDTVMSVNALQTMAQPETALREMCRVLKPGGELLLITYCYGDSSLEENQSLLDWAVRYKAPAVWRSFTFAQLPELLQANGFEVVEADRIWQGPVVAFLRGRSVVS